MATLALTIPQLRLKENEATITSETERFSVALDDAQNYAALVGVVISLFSLVENYFPALLSKLCKLTESDARAILGTFRSTSNRIELIKELEKVRSSQPIDRACLSYYRLLYHEASNIRNKYAHATYSRAKNHFIIHPFSGDFNSNRKAIKSTVNDFYEDSRRMKRIICELHAFCHRNEIPLPLHEKLSQLLS